MAIIENHHASGSMDGAAGMRHLYGGYPYQGWLFLCVFFFSPLLEAPFMQLVKDRNERYKLAWMLTRKIDREESRNSPICQS